MINIHYVPEHTKLLIEQMNGWNYNDTESKRWTNFFNNMGWTNCLILPGCSTSMHYSAEPFGKRLKFRETGEVIHYSLKEVGYGSTCLHMWGLSCILYWAVFCPFKVNSPAAKPGCPQRHCLLNLVYSMGEYRIGKTRAYSLSRSIFYWNSRKWHPYLGWNN